MTTINGVDIKTRYGAYLIDGSYASMLVYPPLKNIVTNDWFEEDGLEVDMSGCTFGTRTFSVKFGVSGSGNWNTFLAFLKSTRRHVLAVSDIGVSFTLRFVSTGSFVSDVDGVLATLSVQYCDDDLSGYLSPSFPESSDGSFGIKVLTGVNELRKMGTPKAALVRSVGDRNGSVSDLEASVKLSSRQIRMNAVMRAASAREFAQNYYALAGLFMAQKVTSLVFHGVHSSVIYVGCTFSSVRIDTDGGVWALLELVWMDAGTLTDDVAATLVVSEDGWLVVTGGDADYWYDFDTMELIARAALASDIKWSVGNDGYLYTT